MAWLYVYWFLPWIGVISTSQTAYPPFQCRQRQRQSTFCRILWDDETC